MAKTVSSIGDNPEAKLISSDKELLMAFLEKVTRMEVIGDTRELVRMNIEIRDLLLQDDGRTLKIVIKDRHQNDPNLALQGKDN